MTDDDRAILDFAALTWRDPGRREDALRERWGTSTEYHRRLGQVIDMPEALTHRPELVHRLRRLRDRRRRIRGAA